MKKINIDEEFACNGRVFSFTMLDGRMTLKNIRSTKVKSEFTPPLISEVEAFFKEKGQPQELAIKFWKYYDDGNWRDKNNNPVKNWKLKASVWFNNNVEKEQPKQESQKVDSKFLF